MEPIGSLAGKWFRASIPILSAFVAVLIDVSPLPDASPVAMAPFLTLCVIFFWAFHRPDLLNSLAIFIIALIYDSLAGMPLGFTALVFLLAASEFSGGANDSPSESE